MARHRNGGGFNNRAPDRWSNAQPSAPFGPKESRFASQPDSYRPAGKIQAECKYWKNGRCIRGPKCKFAHPPRTRENVQRWEIAEDLDQINTLYEPGLAHLPHKPLAGYPPSLFGTTARPAQGGLYEGLCPVPPPDSDGDVHM